MVDNTENFQPERDYKINMKLKSEMKTWNRLEFKHVIKCRDNEPKFNGFKWNRTSLILNCEGCVMCVSACMDVTT